MPKKIHNPNDNATHAHAPPSGVLVPTHNDQSRPDDERFAAIERQIANLIERQSVPAVVGQTDEILEQRFSAIMRQVDSLRTQVEEVRSRPELSADDVNNLSKAMNTRVQSMIDEAVSSLKVRVSTIERSSAPSLANEVQQLGNIVIETGKLVASLDERATDLETEIVASRNRLNEINRAFNANLATSLRAVVEGLQGAPA